jgi:DNA-binding NarL/FixJ family response regulator
LEQECASRLSALGAPVPEQPAGLARLTGSERRAVTLLGTGLDVTEIAERLLFTPGAIRETLAAARLRLGASDDGQLRAMVGAGRSA